MTREEHLLTIAAEECAEVAQRIAKALRFGLEQVQQDANDKPEDNPERLDNRARIWREYLDLVAAMSMLGFDQVSPDDHQRILDKQRKVERYLERSQRCGTLSAVLPAPQEEQIDIEMMRGNLHATFNGGWQETETIRAFHHGMDTVCNVLAAKQKGEGTNGIFPSAVLPAGARPARTDENEKT